MNNSNWTICLIWIKKSCCIPKTADEPHESKWLKIKINKLWLLDFYFNPWTQDGVFKILDKIWHHPVVQLRHHWRKSFLSKVWFTIWYHLRYEAFIYEHTMYIKQLKCHRQILVCNANIESDENKSKFHYSRYLFFCRIPHDWPHSWASQQAMVLLKHNFRSKFSRNI